MRKGSVQSIGSGALELGPQDGIWRRWVLRKQVYSTHQATDLRLGEAKIPHVSQRGFASFQALPQFQVITSLHPFL